MHLVWHNFSLKCAFLSPKVASLRFFGGLDYSLTAKPEIALGESGSFNLPPSFFGKRGFFDFFCVLDDFVGAPQAKKRT